MFRQGGQQPENSGNGDQGETIGTDQSSDHGLILPTHHPIVEADHSQKQMDRFLFPQNWLTRAKIRVIHSFQDWRGRIADLITSELSQRVGFNLLPVGVACGAVVYFAAPAEPSLLLLLAFSAFSCGILWKIQNYTTGFYAVAGFACLCIGMTAGKISSEFNNAPVVQRQITTHLSGIVLEVSQNSRGSPRYLIRPTSADSISNANLPAKVRLSASSKHQTAVPGNRVTGLARLVPFTGPAYPGGFNFYFNAWFSKIGGTGFFMGAPTVESVESAASYKEAFILSINKMRGGIETRIRQALPGEPGDIAIALITGNRTGLDKETQESLRKSGLAHILAISGLHMALVTMTVYGIVRYLNVFIPALVFGRSSHKYAAVAGFSAASFYLLISGMGTATLRAWIMISVMMLASLLDRKAISMRSVAIAALIIVLISPQSILSPGFQMSFAAVAALVAAYEAWRLHTFKKQPATYRTPNSRAVLTLQTIWKYVWAIAFTSIVAGLATGIFSAYHFHRVATLGLVANLLAMPIVSMAVIPLGLLSMLLLPFGLEKISLVPFAYAVETVVDISNYVNGIGVSGVTGILPPEFLSLSALGLAMVTILKTKLRVLAILPFILLGIIWKPVETPDVLIAESGRAVAVKDDTGGLQLLYPRRNRFISEIWLRAWPNDRPTDTPATKTKLPSGICDKERCITRMRNGQELQLVYDPDLIVEACNTADILAAPRLWWVRCPNRQPQLILKRHDFEQYGTHAIYVDAQLQAREREPEQQTEYRVVRAMPSTNRIWDRAVPEK